MLGVIDDTRLEDIAGAIREKTGTEATYTAEKMPAGVNEVYDKGRTDGNNQMMDEWYNAYFFPQDWRNQVYYLAEMFAYRNVDNFKFTKPFPITKNLTGANLDCNRMFACYRGKKLIPPEILNLDGAVFASTTSGLTRTFYYVRNVEECPCYGWNAPYIYDQTFYDALFVTIGTLKSAEHTKYTTTFRGCNNLKNITFDGVIGQNISFSDSPLSVESMKNIILHLANYAGTTNEYAYTLTLKSDRWTALESEGATAPGGITWAEYINELGWNRG
jgi:hypothetical protein